MGMETVELVMAIEKEFGIGIPNNIAPELAFLGDLHAYAVQALRQRPNAAVDPAKVWERLSGVLVREFGIPQPLIVPEAHIVGGLGLD